MTKPKIQKWMEEAIRSLQSQLSCESVTGGSGMETEGLRRYLIACGMQFDDNRFWLAKESVEWLEVPKGQEGADITLEVIGWQKGKQLKKSKKK